MTDARLVKEYETDTAIYREYEWSGGLRMTLITRKATADLPAIAYRTEVPRLRPGNAAAIDAFRQGVEDEYIDGMRCRYGEEW